MPAGFDATFAKVKQLVADFWANEKFYLSPAYQEQEARHDFIDKFWLALGWDVILAARKQLAGGQSGNDFQPSAFCLQPCRFDVLVYDLYALTPAEIQIVEGVAK